MSMEAITPCKVLGSVCMHRPHSGLSASSSSAPLRSCSSCSGQFSSFYMISKCSSSTVLGMMVTRITQSYLRFKPWDVPLLRPTVRKRLNSPLRFLRGERGCSDNWLRQTGRKTIAKFQRFDDFSGATKEVHDEEGGGLHIGKLWNSSQARLIVEKEEFIGGVDSFQTSLSGAQSACFAAISAQTYQPPVQVPGVQRSQVSNYVAGGVLLSVFAWILWVITKTEQYARKALVSPEETLVTPPPEPEMVEQYERAKASVAQAALVNDALAAVRNNDLIKCTVEMELALDQNRIARTSIESDFFDEGELLQVYRGVLKMWLDGYPLDYGKILQLRSLLDIPSKEAENIEQAVQQQSDAYVI